MFPLQSLIFLAGAYTNCKSQLVMPAQKTQNRCNLHPARDGDYSGFFLTHRAASLRIILRRCVPERVVFAAPIGEQFGVTALLNDRALVEHGDLVAEFAGGQAVGDIDGSLIACDLIELAVDLRLGDGVQRRRRLFEDDEGRVLIERAGNGDLLLDGDGLIVNSLCNICMYVMILQ